MTTKHRSCCIDLDRLRLASIIFLARLIRERKPNTPIVKATYLEMLDRLTIWSEGST